MKTLKALVACLFAGLVVMGFVGCGQPTGADDSNTPDAPVVDSYEYNGSRLWDSSDPSSVINFTLKADKDGTWIILMDEKNFMKGTYEGGLTALATDGQITVKLTHSVDESGSWKSDDMDVPVTMSENGKKMTIPGFMGQDLVLTRK